MNSRTSSLSEIGEVLFFSSLVPTFPKNYVLSQYYHHEEDTPLRAGIFMMISKSPTENPLTLERIFYEKDFWYGISDDCFREVYVSIISPFILYFYTYNDDNNYTLT